MTADREKLAERFQMLLSGLSAYDALRLADAAIALIWPAAMREAAAMFNTMGIPLAEHAVLSLLSPDAEKEEGR